MSMPALWSSDTSTDSTVCTYGALAAALQEPTNADGQRAVWVAVTLGTGAQGKDLARLLRLFPSTVDVPPLRHHVEDIQQLAPFFVARLGYQGKLTFSPEVLQILMRSNWPGNIDQVFQTLRQVVQHRRTGVIQPHDLPPETGAVSRRLLSPLESIERDAITQSLLDAQRQQGEGSKGAGHVSGHDLPEDPRVRDRPRRVITPDASRGVPQVSWV